MNKIIQRSFYIIIPISIPVFAVILGINLMLSAIAFNEHQDYLKEEMVPWVFEIVYQSVNLAPILFLMYAVFGICVIIFLPKIQKQNIDKEDEKC